LSPVPTSWSSFCGNFASPFPKLLLDMALQWENCLFLIVKVIDNNCNYILVKFQLHMLKLRGFFLHWIIHFNSQSLAFHQHPNVQAFNSCTNFLNSPVMNSPSLSLLIFLTSLPIFLLESISNCLNS
jgi:hypothetical protein